MGRPAHISNPAGYKVILNDLEVNNVSIKYGDGSTAFSPNTADRWKDSSILNENITGPIDEQELHNYLEPGELVS